MRQAPNEGPQFMNLLLISEKWKEWFDQGLPAIAHMPQVRN